MTTPKNKIIDLETFEVVDKLDRFRFSKLYKISDINTGKEYLAKVHNRILKYHSNKELINLSRELNILSKINHPCFLSFIGFSPINFKDKQKPVLIMDYPKNLTLGNYYDNLNTKKINVLPLTNTQKFIIIYGISYGMKFLHSNNVVHRFFNPYNVYLDDKFYPKISGLSNSIEISPNNDSFIELKLDEWSSYSAPETFLGLEYSKYSDVYSFGLSIFFILASKNPFNDFENLNENYQKVGLNGVRPEMDESIPLCFRNLIEKCWSKEPKNRPTFDEIESELLKNKEFKDCFGSEFDNDAFLDYLKYISESPQEYDSNEYKYDQVEELLLENMPIFNKAEILNERLKYSNSELYINLNDYENMGCCIIKHKETQAKYDANYLQNVSFYLRKEIEIIANVVNSISMLDHPSIIKFGGFTPVNFNGEPIPIFLTEEIENKCTSAKRTPNILITLYGIAAGMAYLHSNNILHRNLKMENIVVNEQGVPKIVGFELAAKIDEEKIDPNETIVGTPAYIAPEVYLHKGYCKSSDVYAFALIVYQLFIDESPYHEFADPKSIFEAVTEKKLRPKFTEILPKAYRELIERCWSQEPKDRPSFDEIAHELKTNPAYLTHDVDVKGFFEFVKFIDEYPVSFDPNKRVKLFDDILQTKLHTFLDINPNFPLDDMYQTEKNDLAINSDYLDMENLEFQSLVATGSFYEVNQVLNKATKTVYAAKKTIKKVYPDPILKKSFFKHEIINFTNELNILLQLNHPSILKFIGHAVYESDHHLIVTEFSSKGSLEKFIQKTNSEKDDTNLNDTQKFIIIYGIVAGMSYLHSNNIIHLDLKPANIYVDDSLYPKISGFNISIEIGSKKVEPNETIKGTPIYIAPEIYLHKGYCKGSDVYSFALVLFEILTGTKPFQTITNPKEIKTEITEKNNRPQFTTEVPKKYQELIERCWSSDPNDRPTFDEILNELRTDPEYLINGMNKEEIQKYIDFIDSSGVSFNTSKRINQLEEYVNFKISEFSEIDTKINRANIWETETNNVSFDLDYINIKTFKKQQLLLKNDDFKYHQVCDTKTDLKFISKQVNKKSNKINEFYMEIELVSQIHHPSILNFMGYSPIDFKSRLNPVIFNENASNGTLDKIFQFEKVHEEQSIIDDTKKLTILYGIASAMSYLQANCIAHGNLKPSNIYLDDFLFPKLSGFEKSKKIPQNQINQIPVIDSNPKAKSLFGFKYRFLLQVGIKDFFDSPESLATRDIHPAYDVYSYSMIAYQLITGEVPYEKEKLGRDSFKLVFVEGFRPEFPESTPECYKKLIEKCWSKDLNKRPTFDEIAYHLKTNPEFITDKVNKEEFINYVNFIEKSINASNTDDVRIDDFIQTQNQSFRKIKIDFSKLRNWKKLHFSVDVGTLNINDFEKEKKVGSGGFGSVYKCIEKKFEKIYAAKISIYEIDQCPEDIIVNLSREVDIISTLNHPSVFKYIGYSPSDFKSRPKPVIITEFASNGSLDAIIEMERSGFGHPDWNDTKKLINIFGIACGMKYLHYLGILHRDLKPGNILLDEFLYPKIADFGLSKKLTNELEDNKNTKFKPSGFKGTFAYCAPEIIEKQEYTTKGDVYAFAMIVYELMTNEVLYQGYNQYRLIIDVLNGYHPELSDKIPYSYKKLIEKCWDSDPEKRPNFNEIVNLITMDRGFITKTVNKEEFLDYVDYIYEIEREESYPSFYSSNKKKEKELDQQKFKVSFDDPQKIKETEEETNESFLDLSKYERKSLKNKGSMFKFYEIQEIETGSLFTAQISMNLIGKLISKNVEDDLINEINILKKINHPSLLKFIGFSPVDFKKKAKPVIVMESFENGTLEDILDIERNGQSIPEWNSTKKIINIYGIASAMSFLHSLGIVHRCLNPSNVFLDDLLFPKLGDFGLSTKFFTKDCITHQSIAGHKGTPIYSAPEIIQFDQYSAKGDVYAFAFVVYEIVANKKPFSEFSNMNDILNEVVTSKRRPNLDDSNIPSSYRKLIERCWSQEQSERPSFEEIVYLLKTETSFITEGVNNENYQKYIKFVEEQTDTRNKNELENHEKLDSNSDILHHIKEAENGNVESQEFLARKYALENDTEKTYKYFCMLIKNDRCDIPLEYAKILYNTQNYDQAFKYFALISRTNNPIAHYFIGVMKFYGKGCTKDIDESYRILKHLSDNGIDRATDFIEDHFKK